ncbi:hypothetical protein MJO28_006920 [Puccinia striiformis f. sp. tritici]|uniref:Uncharacterized protein n=1 Tax=Puccinia striiformis f. sp. tritici TaxID=168172 RepID=A0ACC0ECX4_9BASI|nr:hypothetical protein Pst134EB_014032 [Puccinia striiformis f. sp. tritici]KAI7951236.1 hypothetical protein MJO28_006920 [Puccinia striiformis f. sp. tritici]KAI7955487.1 hypothetical protein MJO29_006886 [Puccinia striiformis f. sp. tritici]
MSQNWLCACRNGDFVAWLSLKRVGFECEVAQSRDVLLKQTRPTRELTPLYTFTSDLRSYSGSETRREKIQTESLFGPYPWFSWSQALVGRQKLERQYRTFIYRPTRLQIEKPGRRTGNYTKSYGLTRCATIAVSS